MFGKEKNLNTNFFDISGYVFSPVRDNYGNIIGYGTEGEERKNALDKAPQLYLSFGGGFSFGLGTIGSNITTTTENAENPTETFNVSGDIGISVPGFYGQFMVGMNFPNKAGSQLNTVSSTIFGISGTITVTENGISSVGVGFTSNLGFNLNSGDIGIANYNLFNSEYNLISGELMLNSPLIKMEK